MTSKEALDELRTVLITNQGTKEYTDIFEKHLLKPIEKDLEILEIIKKIPELVWWVCCYKNAYEMIADRKGFMLDYDMKEIEKQFNKVKKFLEE